MTALSTPMPVAARSTKRFERLTLLLGYPTFLVGIAILLFWVGCAVFGRYLVDPLTGSAPTNSDATCSPA